MVIYGHPIQNDGGINKPNSSSNATSLTLNQKRELVQLARNTINQYVRTGKKFEGSNTDIRFLLKEGAFVTLHKKGQLRGCIGNIVSDKPLYRTVRDMAIASATEDPRFPKVEPAELDEIEVEVSVLSKPKVIKDIDERETKQFDQKAGQCRRVQLDQWRDFPSHQPGSKQRVLDFVYP